MKFLHIVGIVLFVVVLLIRGSSAQDEEGDEEELDQTVNHGDVVTINGKHLLSAPLFCPSNYRIDKKGRCRRIE